MTQSAHNLLASSLGLSATKEALGDLLTLDARLVAAELSLLNNAVNGLHCKVDLESMLSMNLPLFDALQALLDGGNLHETDRLTLSSLLSGNELDSLKVLSKRLLDLNLLLDLLALPSDLDTDTELLEPLSDSQLELKLNGLLNLDATGLSRGLDLLREYNLLLEKQDLRLSDLHLSTPLLQSLYGLLDSLQLNDNQRDLLQSLLLNEDFKTLLDLEKELLQLQNLIGILCGWSSERLVSNSHSLPWVSTGATEPNATR